jgi:3-dehydroquinate synthase
VKHGAIGGRRLLEATRSLLQQFPIARRRTNCGDPAYSGALSDLIIDQVAFKARIVSGDQSEKTDRTDSNSRKILNFGHTLGHALETVTRYRYFKHGEAVGYGVVFAALLSKKLGLLDSNDLDLLNDVVRLVGRLPDIRRIKPDSIIESFGSDKKNIAGNLQWILLEGIGRPAIVSAENIPDGCIRDCLGQLIQMEV